MLTLQCYDYDCLPFSDACLHFSAVCSNYFLYRLTLMLHIIVVVIVI